MKKKFWLTSYRLCITLGKAFSKLLYKCLSYVLYAHCCNRTSVLTIRAKGISPSSQNFDRRLKY